MQIISGKGRGIMLDTVDSLDIRPTSARARKALFDSLGKFDEAIVLDLCAGSGALGLEAASRNAEKVYFVEKDRRHCTVIEKNIIKLQKAGATATFNVLNLDATNIDRLSLICDHADVIFADPPYPISVDIFEKILANENFKPWAKDSLIIWEIPDLSGASGEFIKHKSEFNTFNLRKFGSTIFLIAEL